MNENESENVIGIPGENPKPFRAKGSYKSPAMTPSV